MNNYDVIVIGSGPAGEKASIQAAKLDKKVALIEKSHYLGGTGLRTGTLPSKTLRETALYMSSLKQRVIYGFQSPIGHKVTLNELMHRKNTVIQKQTEITSENISKNNIDIIYGHASFKDEHTLIIRTSEGDQEFYGDVIIIASGSRPYHPEGLNIDGENLYDSDSILKLSSIPGSMTIAGGGVIGCEYACVFSCLGVKVTLIEQADCVLGFADKEIVNALSYWMRHSGIVLRLNEKVVHIEVEKSGRVVTHLESGKKVISEKLLHTLGRVGNTFDLNLESISIEKTSRGLLSVNEAFQTNVSHIYAVGDVIGSPALASTAMDQGRRAVCNAFLDNSTTNGYLNMPFGIYTIPEISMVGRTEESLTKDGIPYEVGLTFFHEVARGQIIGDLHGMLKLLFHRESHKLLGVHIIGERATELIHIGQAVLSFDGDIDYFINNVFNYPTLSEAYKVAALNGVNRL